MENNQPLFSYGVTSANLFSKNLTNKFNLHFNPDGFYNGKNSWLSDDGTVKVIWDTTLNAWKLSGDSLGTTQVINTDGTYPPINGNWTALGSRYTVVANQGVCVPINHLSAKVEFNNPGCVCDGSISVTATGGVPPYSYSYDGGMTYVNTPIKTGLCGGGTTHIKIKDSENIVVSQTIAMLRMEPSVEYFAGIETVSTTQITNTSAEYVFAIKISPPLPSGVNVLFNLNLSAQFMRTPYINSANSTFVPQIIKNGVTLLGTNNTTETVAPNTGSGCQGYSLYTTNYSYVYPSLSVNSTDVYSIKVITNYQLTCRNTPDMSAVSNDDIITEPNNGLGPLGYAQSSTTSYEKCCQAVFRQTPAIIMANLSLNGCNCCKITQSSYVKSLYE